MKTNQATVAGPVNRPPPPAPQCSLIEDNVDYNNGWLSLLENVFISLFSSLSFSLLFVSCLMVEMYRFLIQQHAATVAHCILDATIGPI